MDFTNRNQQLNNRPNPAMPSSEPGPRVHSPKTGHHDDSAKAKWMRWGGGAMVIIVAILIAATLALLYVKPQFEGRYVDSSKLQAVFLTNDQVYFGNIKSINSKYLVLSNIYYLQSNSNGKTAANNNVSLIKLGCELHKPFDQMVINQDQVTFWENLQTDGQVAKAVDQYKKANPNGQKCSDTSPGNSGSQNVQNTQTPTNNSGASNSTNNTTAPSTNTPTNNNTNTNTNSNTTPKQ